MDVQYASLKGYLLEEVYVKQPPSFENIDSINHIFKLHKALYAMK